MIQYQSAIQTPHLTDSNAQHSCCDSPHNPAAFHQTAAEKADEARRIRRLQLLMHAVIHRIEQDRSLCVEHASQLVADVRSAALAAFPDKALAFELLCWPRLQRTMRQRYRMQ